MGNYHEYLGLPNVICAGGSWLTDARLLESEDWEEVQRRAMTINHVLEN